MSESGRGGVGSSRANTLRGLLQEHVAREMLLYPGKDWRSKDHPGRAITALELVQAYNTTEMLPQRHIDIEQVHHWLRSDEEGAKYVAAHWIAAAEGAPGQPKGNPPAWWTPSMPLAQYNHVPSIQQRRALIKPTQQSTNPTAARVQQQITAALVQLPLSNRVAHTVLPEAQNHIDFLAYDGNMERERRKDAAQVIAAYIMVNQLLQEKCDASDRRIAELLRENDILRGRGEGTLAAE